jgi:hypothetical protein
MKKTTCPPGTGKVKGIEASCSPRTGAAEGKVTEQEQERLTGQRPSRTGWLKLSHCWGKAIDFRLWNEKKKLEAGATC